MPLNDFKRLAVLTLLTALLGAAPCFAQPLEDAREPTVWEVLKKKVQDTIARLKANSGKASSQKQLLSDQAAQSKEKAFALKQKIRESQVRIEADKQKTRQFIRDTQRRQQDQMQMLKMRSQALP